MENRKKAQHLVQLDASVAGPLFMLSAALLFTLLNLLIKLIGPQFTIWHIGFYRFFGGIIVLFTIFGRHSNLYRGNNIRLLIIRGCTGSVAFISIITAIRLLPVSTALVIFYSFPAFAAIFSFLIYGERIGKHEIICITVVVIGIGILFDFQLTGGLFGQAIALVGGAFAGLTVTLIKTLREKNGPVIIYLYFCTMGALVTFPKFAMHPILPSTLIEWVMVLGIILASVTAQLLMNQGFFYCSGWEGGVFMSSEVIFTAIVGIAFLGDPATWRFWTGGLMIFGSVVALNRLKSNGQKIPNLKD
ncbi:MAG: DMT family transporter [Thermodesulfobacteriota bacterium]|nr:DMT family transporter [Thermodesulfobacteriota bacterium]